MSLQETVTRFRKLFIIPYFAVLSLALFLSLGLVLQPLKASVQKGQLLSNKSQIIFLGTSNFHSFTGKIRNINGYITSPNKDARNVNSIIIDFDPLSFNTDNTARDENMKRMFEVKEHPLITFRSTNVMVSQDKAFADVTGKLTIRGISKRIVFTARLDKVSSKEIKATGKFKIKLSDFKLKPPSPAFIRVNNEVEVRFDAIVEWEN